MDRLLTPKQASRAIGVSESTLKRWCDRGRIPVTRTAGGHRRLLEKDVLQLVRQGDIPFENPDALGLPPAAGKGRWTLSRAADEATEALLAAEKDRFYQTLLDLYLCGHRMAAICDSVLAPALCEIGTRWHAKSIEVYEERRAVGLVSHTLHLLQALLPDPPVDAPLAAGGFVTGDPYSLPTMMVELVLREEGWRAISLGGPLPFSSLQAALLKDKPRLMWLSASVIEDEDWFAAEYAKLFDSLPSTTALVLGGRAFNERVRSRLRFTSHCEGLRPLCDFVRVLQPPKAVTKEAVG